MLKRHNKVSFTNRAARDLESLSDIEYERIVKGCRRLETDPTPDGKHIKKMQGYADLYRLRVGDYRIVFQVKDDNVIIIRVLIRQDFGNKF